MPIKGLSIMNLVTDMIQTQVISKHYIPNLNIHGPEHDTVAHPWCGHETIKVNNCYNLKVTEPKS
jgi:hypothetical protein